MVHSHSQADEPSLVADKLRLLLAEYLAVVRIVFGEEEERVTVRARPPTQRKGTRSEKVTRSRHDHHA